MIGNFPEALSAFNEILLPYRSTTGETKTEKTLEITKPDPKLYLYRGKTDIKLKKISSSCKDFNVALHFDSVNETKELKKKYSIKK